MTTGVLVTLYMLEGDIRKLLLHLHDRSCNSSTLIAIEHDVWTVFQTSIHQTQKERHVVLLGLFTTEMASDGLEMVIGIHEESRDQFTFHT